jgi:retinol dehydrogenase-13
MGNTTQSSSGQNTHTKVFLVTGATGAIGKAIARQLANIQDSKVVLVCRDQQ